MVLATRHARESSSPSATTPATENTYAATADMFGSGSVRSSPALCRAARWGDRARVLKLIATTGSRPEDVVDARDRNGSTALMWASQFGKDEVVRVLLANGADATARNRFGWSALEYASTSALAGNVLPLLFACPGVAPGRHVDIPAQMLGGAFGRLLCTYDAQPEKMGVAGASRVMWLSRALLERYKVGHSHTHSSTDLSPGTVCCWRRRTRLVNILGLAHLHTKY